MRKEINKNALVYNNFLLYLKVNPGNNYSRDLMNIHIETINLIYFIF